MDIGCAVGRSTFELATQYEEVLGIDFSASFVDKCNELKENGQALYCVPGEGELSERGVAEISKEIVRLLCIYSSFTILCGNPEPLLGKLLCKSN